MVAAAKSRSEILAKAMHLSSELTASFYRMYRRGASMYLPEEIIKLLLRAKVRFILMGTHGVGAWRSEPRATQDVDFLVAKRDHAKAVRAVQEAFPELELIDGKVVTRFKDKKLDKVVIDLMKPNQPLFRVAFRNCIEVSKDHYKSPNLEFALASKFAAMVSHHRVISKKYVDIGDFIDIVMHNRDAIDIKKLEKLGERVYSSGGKEIRKLVEDILAGRKIDL